MTILEDLTAERDALDEKIRRERAISSFIKLAGQATGNQLVFGQGDYQRVYDILPNSTCCWVHDEFILDLEETIRDIFDNDEKDFTLSIRLNY